MAKNVTYKKAGSWKDKGVEITMLTQLYQVGIYCIIEGGGERAQFNFTPKEIVKLQKKIDTLSETGKITDLEWSGELTVNPTGLLQEVA